MLLVVLVTLMVSIMGLFAQVAAVQTAKLYNAQNGFAQTMLAWHNGAASLIHAAQLGGAFTSFSSTGCLLTSTTGAVTQAMPPCSMTPFTNLTTGSAYLPQGYKASSYGFYSTAYQGGASPYVVTYIGAPDTYGYVHVPDTSGASTGLKVKDVLAQFSRLSTGNVAYGLVNSGHQLIIYASTSAGVATSFTYPVPTAVPANAIALISLAN